MAQELDATPQQVTLALILAKSPTLVTIPGSSRPETVRASAAAADLQLSPDQVSQLDRSSILATHDETVRVLGYWP